jgi:hypothetical protein
LDTPIVASFTQVLQVFAPCFTAPSMQSFVTLMAGWVLDLRRHTVTEVIRAAGAVGRKHISSYHRFFSQGRWSVDRYPQKAGVTFSDMLATIRRASWRERLLDPDASVVDLRKRLRPLVDYVASAA